MRIAILLIFLSFNVQAQTVCSCDTDMEHNYRAFTSGYWLEEMDFWEQEKNRSHDESIKSTYLINYIDDIIAHPENYTDDEKKIS